MKLVSLHLFYNEVVVSHPRVIMVMDALLTTHMEFFEYEEDIISLTEIYLDIMWIGTFYSILFKIAIYLCYVFISVIVNF